MMTRATGTAGTTNDPEYVNEVEQGRDVRYGRVVLTIDSAGSRFNAESAVHSCINIATQKGDDDERSNCGGTVCARELIMQRLPLAVAGILVIVLSFCSSKASMWTLLTRRNSYKIWLAGCCRRWETVLRRRLRPRRQITE